MTKSRKTTPTLSAKPSAQVPTARQDYRVRATGWAAGRRVTEGDILSLTEAEARYEPVDLVSGSAAAPKGTDTE